ncbi:cytochrome c family protein [Rhodosalinus sp. 5P4]|uniref:c-type cytochrome n=1 Tax=Rhodosalinus sp. 5P4 TaxID=3239196 RepID=UPI003526A717
MPDTMTFTKVFGSLCGALLVFLLGKWAAEELYHVGVPYGEQQAYVIDTGEEEEEVADAAPVEEEEEVPFVQLLANASADAGEGVFRQCSACHVVDQERNGVGPHLVNVMGREIASIDGFRYSGALPEGAWTWEEMNAWIENPRDYAPGTSMGYGGLADDEDRADLIAYLGSYTEGWTLPGADAAVEEAAAEAPAEDMATEEAAAEDAAPEEPAAEEAAEEEVASEDTATEDVAMEDTATEEAATEEMTAADDASEDASAGGEMSELQMALAEADVGNGERVFRQCSACHVANQEQNRVGPHLVGIIGREIGAVDGFRYSGALPEGVWTAEEMDAWLENPRDYAPGTSMGYAGLRDLQDRADLIAWLDSLDD